jgi:hypothetical protein
MAEINPKLPLTTADVIYVSWFFRDIHESTLITSLHFWNELAGPSKYTAAQLLNIAGFVDSQFTNLIRPALPIGTSLEFINVAPMKTSGVLAAHQQVGLDGTMAGEHLPPFVSVGIQKRTSTRGKRGRGMMRMPAPTEDAQLDGSLIPAAQNVYTTLRNAFLAGFTPVTPAVLHTPCMCTRENYDALTDTWQLRAQSLTTMPLNVILGSQATRKIGRGI